MELLEVFKKLEEKEGFQCGEVQNPESIQEVENKLKLKLPQTYKDFLRRYGYVKWNEGCIYGISKRFEEDVVHKNKLIRQPLQPEEYMKLPEDAFLIKDYEDAFFMLFAQGSSREGEVVLYLSEYPEVEEKSWDSFQFFLEDYCL